MNEGECVFCAVAAGRAPASLCYEDEHALVVMDINPVTPGHMLVLSRQHVESLTELDEDNAAHLFTVTQRAARALRRAPIRCEGLNIFVADGEAAFQEIFHFHIHVFPRFQGDGFSIHAEWTPAKREELDELAGKLREAFA